jgi:transcriptional regulator with XRE-family HTH domain
MRKISDYSLSEIEALTGRDMAELSRWFGGVRAPRPGTIVELAQALDVDPYALGRCFSDAMLRRYLKRNP